MLPVSLCVLPVCASSCKHHTERMVDGPQDVSSKSDFGLRSVRVRLTGLFIMVRAGFVCACVCGLTASALQIVLATWRQRVRSQALLTVSSPVSWKLNSRFSCSVGGRTTKAKAFTHSGRDSTGSVGRSGRFQHYTVEKTSCEQKTLSSEIIPALLYDTRSAAPS